MKTTTLIGFALSMVLGTQVQAQMSRGTYDGAWWQGVAKDERTGFLAGYIDCGGYQEGKKYLLDISWDSAELAISKYYRDNPSEANKAAGVLLANLAAKNRHVTPDGDEYSEKHGIFDGEYWRQASSGHHTGYIEGYLWCLKEADSANKSFPHDANWYAERISQWYGVRDDDPGEINPTRVTRKIAYVLYALKKQ